MRRFVWLFLVLSLALLALGGCGADKDSEATEAVVDVDLSALNTNIALAQVNVMYAEPWNFLNKSVRIKGILDFYVSDSGAEHSMVMVADAAACCAQGIEFSWAGDGRYADVYPGLGEEVTVTGRFELYQEDGFSRIRLSDAEVEWKQLET